MNLKLQPKFKSYGYRLCDERDCEKIAWKIVGRFAFCEKHDRIYKEEEKAKEQHGNASAAIARQST